MRMLLLVLVVLFLPTTAGARERERFKVTREWAAVESLVWTTAKDAGATTEERRVLLGIAWNETRGRPGLVGDDGCAWGMFQIHVGGLGTKRQVCHSDARLVLPLEYDLPREACLDATLSTRAALLLLRMRGSRSNADAALASYAGCQRPTARRVKENDPPTCAERVLERHRWWRETGLDDRWAALEGVTVEREKTRRRGLGCALPGW